MKHILMIKRCMATGLMYLCKTTAADPYKYNGSGTWWKRHIKQHNSWIVTCVIGEYGTAEDLTYWGLHYSTLFDVVNSPNWANLTEEKGSGGKIGDGQLGKTWKIKDTSLMSQAKKQLYATERGRVVRDNHRRSVSGYQNYQYAGTIVTPWGRFDSIKACIIRAKDIRSSNPAAKVISDVHTIKKYITNLDVPLDPTGRRTILEWRGKTPRSLGFDFIKKDNKNGKI